MGSTSLTMSVCTVFLFLLFHSTLGLRITSLTVPPLGYVGESLKLLCTFELDKAGEILKHVTVYKGNKLQRVFGYHPNAEKELEAEGVKFSIHIDQSKNYQVSVTLPSLDVSSKGKYTCAVATLEENQEQSGCLDVSTHQGDIFRPRNISDEVSTNTNIIDDSNYEIEIVDAAHLPALGSTRTIDSWGNMNLPLGFQDIPLVRIELTDCKEELLLVWTENKGRNIGLIYQDMFYYFDNTDSQAPSKLVFFVKNHTIINNEGAGSIKQLRGLQRTLRLDRNWMIKEDNLQIALTLVSRGLIKKLNSLNIKNPRPDQLPSIISLIPVSSSVSFEAVNLTNAQWKEVVDAFGDEQTFFSLEHVRVSVDIAATVAKLASKAERVKFSYVKFDDPRHFFGLLGDYLDTIDGKCREVAFLCEYICKYATEVIELGNKLAWGSGSDYGYYEDEDYRVIRRDEQVMQRRKEQRNEAIRQTFKQMLMDENIDILEQKLDKIEKLDSLEKKLDDMTNIIEMKDQQIQELERKLNEDCRM